MIFSMAFYGCMVFLAVSGFLLLGRAKDRQYRFRGYAFLHGMRQRGGWLLGKGAKRNLFEGTGLCMSTEVYLGYLCAAAGVCLLIGLLSSAKAFMTAAFLILLLGAPLEKAADCPTPFGLLVQSARRSFMQKKEAEMYEAMTMLRNMAIMKKDRPVSGDHMIEGLMASAKYMGAYYSKMIGLIRLDKREEALETFTAEVGTPLARSFGRLLVKLDEINPARLEETVLMHQKSLREERFTRNKERDEMISDLIYAPVVLNVLLIFINFMVISYFIQQKEFLGIFLG